MRSSFIFVLAPVALLTTLALSGSAATAQDQANQPPSPAPGLWRLVTAMNGQPVALTGMEMCYGDAASMAKFATPPDMADCVPDTKTRSIVHNADGSSSMSLDCTLREGGTMTGKMTFSGDFKTRLTMVTEVKPSVDPNSVTMTMTGTRLGDCRPGQAPGEFKADPINLADMSARVSSPEIQREIDAPVDNALELAIDVTGPGGLRLTENVLDFGRTAIWVKSLPGGRLISASANAGPDVRIRIRGSVQSNPTGLGAPASIASPVPAVVVTSGETATIDLPGDLVLKVTPTLRPLSAEEAKWQQDGGRPFLRRQAGHLADNARRLAEGQIDAEGAAALALGMKVREPIDVANFQRLTSAGSPTKALMNTAIQARRRKDYAAAIQAYRSAADQGDPEAALLLGGMYDIGEGVKTDKAQALKLIRQAAEKGDASAQFELGEMYQEGGAIPPDAAESAKWTRLAAEGGEENAQFSLGLMYRSGKGMPKDPVKAYVWFTAASLDGSKLTRQSRDEVLAQLSPEEAVQAKRLADQCLASTFKRCEG